MVCVHKNTYKDNPIIIIIIITLKNIFLFIYTNSYHFILKFIYSYTILSFNK